MGFNIGGAFSGAISGAASGFMMGGPYGALAGGVIGGAAGGFGVGGVAGGPTSAGGITGGRRSGQEASEYYDAAFPGTNPWERLGAGNPMGQMVAANVASKTQMRNVDRQTSTQQLAVAKQTKTQQTVANTQANAAVKVASIHGRAAAAQTATNYPPGSAPGLMKAVVDGPDTVTGTGVTAPGAIMRGAVSHERTSAAAQLDSWTRQRMGDLKSRELDIKAGKEFGDPGTAKLASLATKAFDIGMSQTDLIKWMRDNPKILTGMGIAIKGGKALTSTLANVFGGRMRMIPRKTSVGAPGR